MDLFPGQKDFGEFGRRFFEENFGDRLPSMMNPIRTDIRELDNEYVLEAELAGFTRENINLEFDNNVLTISAKQEYASDEKDTTTDNYIRRERYSSSYKRQFVLQDVDDEKIQATFENGLLTVHLPKLTSAEPTSRQIDID